MGEEKRPWYVSVSDGQNMAMTAKGIITTVVPIFLWGLKAIGHEVAPESVTVVTDAVLNFLVMLSALFTAGVTLVGAVRKLYFRLTNNLPEQK